MSKDLHEDKDGAWQFVYPSPDSYVALGEGRVYHEERQDLCIVTFGNGVYFSLRVARRLAQEGIQARVLDLRWLNHYDVAWMMQHVEDCGRALVVDEGRRSGGLGEGLVTAIVENARRVIPMQRVVGEDTYIPLGPAANAVLPSEEQILAAARSLTGRMQASHPAGQGPSVDS
jgi:2-oxoisovalerate dehydrogenase E1 component